MEWSGGSEADFGERAVVDVVRDTEEEAVAVSERLVLIDDLGQVAELAHGE